MTVTDPFTTTRPATQGRGACAVCGFETILTRVGTPGYHFEQRVKGRDAEGKPVLRASNTPCGGRNQPAEPLWSEAAS